MQYVCCVFAVLNGQEHEPVRCMTTGTFVLVVVLMAVCSAGVVLVQALALG